MLAMFELLSDFKTGHWIVRTGVRYFLQERNFSEFCLRDFIIEDQLQTENDNAFRSPVSKPRKPPLRLNMQMYTAFDKQRSTFIVTQTEKSSCIFSTRSRIRCTCQPSRIDHCFCYRCLVSARERSRLRAGVFFRNTQEHGNSLACIYWAQRVGMICLLKVS